MEIYEPQEDSYLVEKFIRPYAFGRVLDMGTGSGILALSAIKNPNVREVIAVDINPDAVEKLQKKIDVEKLKKIKVKQSDLFEHVEGQYHLILFNPPYLPQDQISGKVIEDWALYGGKKGWEVLERFFKSVDVHLTVDGVVLFLFSSLTNKEKVEEIIGKQLLDFKEVGREKLSFEELYVYEVRKSALLQELAAKGVSDINYLAKGKRGMVYTGNYDTTVNVKKLIPLGSKKIKVAIKVKRKDSEVMGNIANEVKWLGRLNKEGIGSRFLFSGEHYLVYEFVDGEEIINFIEKSELNAINKVILDVLKQCYKMDLMKVNKEEMHHPVKHILVNKLGKAVMIDFERCKETLQPQNVTQFVEFLCRIKDVLEKKGLRIDIEGLRNLSKQYKESYAKENFEAIVKGLGL